MIVAKISADNVVPLMLAPKNPIHTGSEQTSACLSKLSNMIKEGTHLDDPEQGHSPSGVPLYEYLPNYLKK